MAYPNMESTGNYETSEARDCGSRSDSPVDGASVDFYLGWIRTGGDLALLRAVGRAKIGLSVVPSFSYHKMALFPSEKREQNEREELRPLLSAGQLFSLSLSLSLSPGLCRSLGKLNMAINEYPASDVPKIHSKIKDKYLACMFPASPCKILP